MVYNEEIIKHALAYEDLFRILRYEENEEGFGNVLSQMVEFASGLTEKGRIDLLTLMYIGRFQDADMTLEPQDRFYRYRQVVKSVIIEEGTGDYIRTSADISLEIAAALAFGKDTNFTGNSRLVRGLVMVQMPTAENLLIPYSNFELSQEK